MTEPIRVIPLEYGSPEPAAAVTWRLVIGGLHVLGLVCCGLAVFLIVWVTVLSVLVTGPILFLIGVLLVISGALAHDRRALWFGVSHATVCLFFVFLVNLLEWGPDASQAPFAVMGTLYTLGVTVVAMRPGLFGKLAAGRRPSGDVRP